MVTLCRRERESLALFFTEHTGKQAAYRLGISDKTYFTYKASAMEKLRVGNDVGLVKYLLSRGYTPNSLAPWMFSGAETGTPEAAYSFDI